ncbi:MAG: transcription-repair coupling factor [Proteobacteria bacterium]|nr:transcription-repair coupling factor [Pseudomonadota bacterium]
MSQASDTTTFQGKIHQAIKRISQSPRSSTLLSSLSGSAGTLFVSQLADNTSKPIVILAETYETAEAIRQDLAFLSDESTIGFFPQWDVLPFDNQSPGKEVLATRFKALSGILTNSHRITITTPNAVMQYLMPVNVFLEHSFEITSGDTYDREHLLGRLVNNGFVRVEMVEERGEFSVRGEIIDLFPLNEDEPVRLDFFDDELESIKFFDIETQRSKSQLESLTIFPAQEVLYTDSGAQKAIERLIPYKANTVPQTYGYIVEQIQAQAHFSAIENLLPLFYESVASVFDYFTQAPLVMFFDKEAVVKRSDDYFNEILSEYSYSKQEGNPTLDPDSLLMTVAQLQGRLEDMQSFNIQSLDMENNHPDYNFSTVDNTALRSLAVDAESPELSTVETVMQQLKTWNRAGAKVMIAANSYSKADRIRQMLEKTELSIPIQEKVNSRQYTDFLLSDFSATETSFCITPSPVSSGFRWIDSLGATKVALVTEEEIFGLKKRHRRVGRSGIKQVFSSLSDLNVGDFVVHVEYGIGKYEGLKKIAAGQYESDYLVIVYHGGDKVYVPVDKFHLVQKYTGGEVGQARISKLGNKTWSKTKSKVQSEIDDMAEELVKINAIRKAKKGVAFSPDSTLMNEFTLSFIYQETEDQEKAIREVLQDMESDNPMDRLVCGDVGFGKTEVAMRAAYKAVIDGYQVGILVPTTILAQQHHDSFKDRFANTPVEVRLLSRFQTPKQIKETINGLKNGKVDIVIGTHRMLSKDVVFTKLGLLVIDEEQRFGVKHKEKIKQFRTTVDSLTLSATPIPRTLHMSLVGIRDISVINTPPMDRRAIRTRLMKFNDYVIQESVNREIRRNGQVFFIHNRVESIYQVGQYLNKIMPTVKIAVAHGQMAERDLEQVMMDFIQHRYDILLATTIVESGLDIPNVNTIIVNNADQFGLSQLYQLRGRVGRSNVQAYAYLLTPREKILSETARKRLAILQELNHLGAGFKIANYDLELRGAGNVLGAQQSGHIAAVGFELYTSMIEDAVTKIQLGEARPMALDEEIKLNLMLEAGIPDTYIESMNHRLDAYKSISGCINEDELWEVRGSLEDRYGKMPEETICLFHTMQIKFLANTLYISQITQTVDSLELSFTESFKPEPQNLLNYLAESKNMAKLLPDNRLLVQSQNAKPDNIIRFLHSFRKQVLQPTESD